MESFQARWNSGEFALMRFAGLRVEFREENSPPGSKPNASHSRPSRIQHRARINGVERTAVSGRDDRSAIRPQIIRRRRIKRGAGREADGGDRFLPGGRCVIQKILSIHAHDIRRPGVTLERRHQRRRPRRRRAENNPPLVQWFKSGDDLARMPGPVPKM